MKFTGTYLPEATMFEANKPTAVEPLFKQFILEKRSK
jgi:hypothetical protein